MANNNLQQRVADSLRRSYFKRWYQRPWGKLILLGIILLGILVAYYLYLTAQYYKDITNFDFSQPIQQLRQDEIFRTLISGDDPTWGNPDASVVVVEFGDFQCPYCQQSEPILKQVKEKYQDKVLFIFRDFPLSTIHDQAQSAAEAAGCAAAQDRYWDYHEQLFARQNELSPATYRSIAEALGLDIAKFNICLNTGTTKTEISGDIADGTKLGVTGTPTFFINGQIFPGVLKYDFWDKVLTVLTADKQQ